MADSVRVQFSASIGALIKGVDDAKKAIDSVKESTDRVSEGAKSLLEAFGVAFSVEKISEFISRMGDLGEKTEHMAAILGTSTEQIGRFDAIAKGTGTSTEGLAKAFEIFQANLNKARTGTGPAADALRALGLSARDFINLPIDQQINKFADAVSKFGDGGTKLAAVRALLGRMGDDLIPTLDKGAAGLRELGEMADRAGTALDAKTAKGFEETHLKLVELGLSVEGVGIRVFKLLEPAIDQATSAVTKFIEGIDSNTIETAFRTIGNVMIDIAEQVMTFFAQLGGSIDTFTEKLTLAMPSIQLTGFAASVVRFLQLKDVTIDSLKDLYARWDETIQVLGEPPKPEGAETIKGNIDRIHASADAARKALADYIAETRTAGTAEGPGNAGKPQVPEMPDTSRQLAAQLEGYQKDIKAADDAFKLKADQLGAEVKLHQITVDEETAQLLAALDKRHAAEDAAYNSSLQLAQNDAKEYGDLQKKKQAADDAFALKHQQILEKQLEEDTKEWQAVLQPIESAFNSQLRALLAGTETFGQAMKKVFSDLVIDIIQYIEKLILEFIALKLASALGFGPQQLAGAMKAIAANTGVVFSGEVANLAPSLGPAAPAAAAGITAAVTATSIGLSSASLETGAWSVPGGLANLHAGEMVVPQTFASALRSAVSGDGGAGSGDTHVHFNVSAMDASSVQRFFSQNGNQIARSLQGASARNPSLGWA